MTDTDAVQLEEEQDFVLLLDRLKDIERHNPVSTGDRRERVAEHSWHVAMCTMLLRHTSRHELDTGRMVQLALIHDLAELYVGDTFAYGDDVDGQRAREHGAINKLRSETRSEAIITLIGLWDEYEAQKSPEARFVKAMDVYLPIALNNANPSASSWRIDAVAASRVRERLARVRNALGELANQCDMWIRRAKARGDLA